jgi:hypothetical protein
MEPVYVAKNPHEKAMQRALIQYKNPENYDLVKEALIKEHREDLIGFGEGCLIPPRKIVKTASGNQKNKAGSNSDKPSGKNGKAEYSGKIPGRNVKAERSYKTSDRNVRSEYSGKSSGKNTKLSRSGRPSNGKAGNKTASRRK